MILLTKHCETIQNADNIICGQLEGTLSDTGINQAVILSNNIKKYNINIIYTSDLQRAINTSIIIFRNSKIKELIVIRELRERFLGSSQGKKVNEIRQSDYISYENISLFHKRLTKAYKMIKEKEENNNILIISHEGVCCELSKIINNKEIKKINYLELIELNDK